MAGYLMCVLPPTLLTATGVTVANNTILFPIAQCVDISRYEDSALGIRIHNSTITGTDGKFDVYVITDGYTPDDPTLNWMAVSGNPIVSVTSDATMSYTSVGISGSGGPGPGLLAFLVRGTRLTNTTTALSCKISIDVMFKTAGAGGMRPGSYMGYGALPVR